MVTTLLMDGEFEPLRGDLANMGITLNTSSRNKHVPKIERHISTLKEGIRCVYNTLPFKHVPAHMVVEMVYYGMFWLNSFPPTDGMSTVLGPWALIVGTQLDYTKHCQLEFGAYVQNA
jgi:hypothetical protein